MKLHIEQCYLIAQEIIEKCTISKSQTILLKKKATRKEEKEKGNKKLTTN